MRQRKSFPLTLAALILAAAVPARSGSDLPTSKKGHYASNLQYTGGAKTGFDLQQIRWGDHRDFERIVLEFNSPDPSITDKLPKVKLETEYYPVRLAIRLPGSRYGSGNFAFAGDLFRKSRLISGLDVYDVCDGGPHLAINAARPVEFEIFTLTSPPRLVVDVILSRMPPMREELKYSVRTLSLFGDQVCLLLGEAADAGVTPRLLTDADGNVFGELGLFDEAEEAFAAVDKLKDSVGKKYSLTVKARGMMTVPVVIP